MSNVDGYIRAISSSHRLLIGACLATFALSLYLGHVNYLDSANAQLVELDQAENGPISVDLTPFYENAVIPKLSAASKKKLGYRHRYSVDIVIEDLPPVAGLPLSDNFDTYETITRLLTVYLPNSGLSFRTATLDQIRDALGTFVFIPDLSAENYLRKLDTCIQRTNFTLGSTPLLIVRINHKVPREDLEIPGSEAQKATVLLSPTTHGPQECFTIDGFTPYPARTLIGAGDSPGPLPLFDGFTGPPRLGIGADLWEELKNLTPPQAMDRLRTMALSDRPVIPAIGTSVPATLLPIAVPLTILFLQLLLLSHLRAAIRATRDYSVARDWAWTGLYPDFVSRAVTWTSLVVVPTVVTALLPWQLMYTSALVLLILGSFRVLLMVMIFLSGVATAARVRELRLK